MVHPTTKKTTTKGKTPTKARAQDYHKHLSAAAAGAASTGDDDDDDDDDDDGEDSEQELDGDSAVNDTAGLRPPKTSGTNFVVRAFKNLSRASQTTTSPIAYSLVIAVFV